MRITAFALHMLCICIALVVHRLGSGFALAYDLVCFCKLVIDALVPPSFTEQRGHNIAAFSPFVL